jgi:hypothetical protein
MIRAEKFLYETRPINLLFIALASTAGGPLSRWGQVSIALLALSALVLFYWRYQYRSTVQVRRS